MTKYYPVIGNPNVGKSSLIRALSGVGNMPRGQHARLWNLEETLNGVSISRKFLITTTSLQERCISPSDYVSYVSTHPHVSNVYGVISALWVSAHSKNPNLYPDANAYVSHFRNIGWNIQPALHLAPTVHSFPFTNHHLNNSTPTNKIASIARPLWAIT